MLAVKWVEAVSSLPSRRRSVSGVDVRARAGTFSQQLLGHLSIRPSVRHAVVCLNGGLSHSDGQLTAAVEAGGEAAGGDAVNTGAAFYFHSLGVCGGRRSPGAHSC